MSTYTSTQGELNWFVSRVCESGACIKVARKGELVLIGKTGSPDGPFSEFTTEEWRHFLAGARSGNFDAIA
jgi:Domain of unknown function (DUF397)